MIITTPQQKKILREGGRRLALVMEQIKKNAVAGVSAFELDKLAQELIYQIGGRPSFKGYKPEDEKDCFPASLCVSINEEVVHGIPSKKKILKEGDIISLDLGMEWPFSSNNNSLEQPKGLYTDMAITKAVGNVSPEAKKLIKKTKLALYEGIKAVREGCTLGDVGYAIQRVLQANGFGIIRILAGHGVGKAPHEEPLIPNYGTPGKGAKIKKNMVLAIEPMATLGTEQIELMDDGWTYKTKDNSLSAHFEHTVIVTDRGAEIITSLANNHSDC